MSGIDIEYHTSQGDPRAADPRARQSFSCGECCARRQDVLGGADFYFTDAIRRRDIVWECESDGGWVAYEEALAVKLERALSASKRATTWQHGTFTYRVDWARMVQVNTSTNKERAIRRTESGVQTLPPAPARGLEDSQSCALS